MQGKLSDSCFSCSGLRLRVSTYNTWFLQQFSLIQVRCFLYLYIAYNQHAKKQLSLNYNAATRFAWDNSANYDYERSDIPA